ncbi:transglycosylase SLT domain-containing protein [Sphingomonas antarctica]|uniref:lytic transglycosylase domain-containing protein n=1 Tax=Sphingomonas antarctica TaxID=2040274 RepID=UPI0039ED74A0
MTTNHALAALALTLAGPAYAQSFAPIEASNPAIAGTLLEWKALRASATLPFERYATFLIAHPGWPGESGLRGNAERNLRADAASPNTVVAFFGRYAPQSASAGLRYAEALNALGRSDAARVAARKAWTAGAFGADDEARLQSRFGSALTQSDQDNRMERLLWSRNAASAARQLTGTSPIRQPIYAIRLAFQRSAPDSAEQLGLAPTDARSNAGFIIDQASWLRATGQLDASRSLFANRPKLDVPPYDATRWLDTMLSLAKEAAGQGNWSTAYAIASKLTDAYPDGVQVRDRSLAERDDYTSLAWLAGTTALDKLNRPNDAVRMFDLYANAAKTPSTRAKGLYWAGRAAERAGDRFASRQFFEQAADYFDQFHGQLALERLGKPLELPPQRDPARLTPEQRATYDRADLPAAARYLGQIGDWATQSLFLRAIAQDANSDSDHALGYDFAARIGRPDLAVMIGRSAGVNGYRDQLRPGFPVVPIPDDARGSWIMVHAIARQESQFDRKIVSRAGAVGVMQLMTPTAQETANRSGIGWQPASMTEPTYNMRLGSWYFTRLLQSYGGNYVLAVAAYNAGGGNVNKWLAANGDPRTGTDTLKWIEAIPFSETRAYVQHVLENAVVYGLLAPDHAPFKGPTPLSNYLGRSSPG